MRYILIFWGLPISLFWGWYALSYHDINFGMLFFSRAMHDFVFIFYGRLIGIDPAIIPPLVARACVVDTALIFGIFGYRRRREISAWYRASRLRDVFTRRSAPAAGRAPPAE